MKKIKSNQKLIKYFVITIAFLIIASMIGGLVSLIITIFNISAYKNNQVHEIYQSNTISATLDIDLQTADLEIKLGDNLSVETDSKYVSCNQEDKRIVVKEKKHLSLKKKDEYKIIITIPRELMFDIVDIETDAGKIYLEELQTKRLNLKLGAGVSTINNLVVTDKAKIDGGASKFVINNGTINNLSFDMGVGETIINAGILGNSDIFAEIGKLEVNLNGTINDYSISVSKGIGSIKFNEENLKNDTIIGNGNNYLTINGGVGSIKITTQYQ